MTQNLGSHLLPLDLLGGEGALLAAVERFGPQRAVPPLGGRGHRRLAAGLLGGAGGLAIAPEGDGLERGGEERARLDLDVVLPVPSPTMPHSTSATISPTDGRPLPGWSARNAGRPRFSRER